jgi:hypothetical protein
MVMQTSRVVREFVLALLVAGMAWAGDTRPVTAHQREASKTGAKPAGGKAAPGIPDAQLEAAIRAKFAKSKINADHFQVRVQGGVATIEGKTDVIQHKGVATRMARTAGAVAVNNHIQTSEAARQRAAANLEQGRRRAQVKRGEARSTAAESRQGR